MKENQAQLKNLSSDTIFLSLDTRLQKIEENISQMKETFSRDVADIKKKLYDNTVKNDKLIEENERLKHGILGYTMILVIGFGYFCYMFFPNAEKIKKVITSIGKNGIAW